MTNEALGSDSQPTWIDGSGTAPASMEVQFAHGQSVRSPRGPAGVDFYIATGRRVSRIDFIELSNLSSKVV